jgi:hypothetical protein
MIYISSESNCQPLDEFQKKHKEGINYMRYCSQADDPEFLMNNPDIQDDTPMIDLMGIIKDNNNYRDKEAILKKGETRKIIRIFLMKVRDYGAYFLSDEENQKINDLRSKLAKNSYGVSEEDITELNRLIEIRDKYGYHQIKFREPENFWSQYTLLNKKHIEELVKKGNNMTDDDREKINKFLIKSRDDCLQNFSKKQKQLMDELISNLTTTYKYSLSKEDKDLIAKLIIYGELYGYGYRSLAGFFQFMGIKDFLENKKRVVLLSFDISVELLIIYLIIQSVGISSDGKVLCVLSLVLSVILIFFSFQKSKFSWIPLVLFSLVLIMSLGYISFDLYINKFGEKSLKTSIGYAFVLFIMVVAILLGIDKVWEKHWPEKEPSLSELQQQLKEQQQSQQSQQL